MTPDIVVRSQPIPLCSERIQDKGFDSRDLASKKTMEFDDTVHDPTWRSGWANQSRALDDNNLEIMPDSPRYYSRSRDRQNYELQTSGEPSQVIATPGEQSDQPPRRFSTR